MRPNRLRLAATLLALAAVGLVGAGPRSGPTRFGQIDDARMANAAKEPQNWLLHSGNEQSWRYSALDQINVDTIKDLKPAWHLEFDTNRGQQATPIVVDGVAYVSTAWSKVYAVNAKTGEQIWYFDPKVPGETARKACCDVVNRGVAVYKGKVYVGALDGRLIALDARTGRQVWSTWTVDPTSTYTVTSAPRVGGGLVFIGNAGGEFGGRGYVGAYDAETGKFAWRFYLTPGKPGVKDNAASDEIMDKLVQPTWFGEHNDYRGGGHVWGSLIYDSELKQVLLATGNGYPWNRYFRSAGKGDNLFLASIVALDAKTGRYRWHYQETPGETWDLDAVSDIVMFDLEKDGRKRKALIHTPKGGYAWEIDRETGELISGVPFVPGLTWTTGIDPVTKKPIMVDSNYYDDKNPVRASGFAHSWHPVTYSPKTRYLYLQASQGPPGLFTPKPTFEYIQGFDHRGIYVRGETVPAETLARQPPAPADAPPRRSYLMAWDTEKQAPAWQTDGSGNGTFATAGNLVFQGVQRSSVMGTLKAFRADTGKLVWSYDTPHAIVTAPISYMIDGEQYIMVPIGASMFPPIPTDVRERQNGRLVAFKLNGKATLPPDPPMARPFVQVTNDQKLSAADMTWANDTFARACAQCHGAAARNNNVIPDLRRSPYLTSAEAWKAVVEDGALTATGMVGFGKILPAGSAEKLRAYVAEQARIALAPPPANATAPPPPPSKAAQGANPPTEH